MKNCAQCLNHVRHNHTNPEGGGEGGEASLVRCGRLLDCCWSERQYLYYAQNENINLFEERVVSECPVRMFSGLLVAERHSSMKHARALVNLVC